MNTQRKYRCRKCGIDMPAGPYIAPEMCSACQLAANAKRPESTSEITPEMIYRVAELHRTIKEQAAEIERLRAYTDAYNTLLAERVEVECLRGLAIRAWHSFRSGGLTQRDGMPYCLSDGDMAELKRLADADAAKLREQPPA